MTTESQFTVGSYSDTEIRIAHSKEGHGYSYYITARALNPTVSYHYGNDDAKHGPEYFDAEARHFAETEARKLNLID